MNEPEVWYPLDAANVRCALSEIRAAIGAVFGACRGDPVIWSL